MENKYFIKCYLLMLLPSMYVLNCSSILSVKGKDFPFELLYTRIARCYKMVTAENDV